MTPEAGSAALTLDPETMLRVARAVLGRPEATAVEWDHEKLAGLGFLASIHRVSGVALDGDERLAWSVIRKSVPDTRDHETDLRYWKREPLAYTSGLLDGLASVGTPRCLEQVQDETGVVLWLEDVRDDGGGATVGRFVSVARDLGRLSGEFACGRAVPDDAWLSRRWLRGWVEQAAPAFAGFRSAVEDPLLSRIYPESVATTMSKLWESRDHIFDLLDASPQVLSHLDAVPTNVIVRGGQTVLVDWAFVGLAAIGEELASLVGGSTLFGGPPPQELARLDSLAFAAYVDGLRDTGWTGDAAFVRFVYCAAAALRYGVGPAAFMVCGVNPDGSIADVGGIRDSEQRDFMATSFGLPFEELMDIQADGLRFLMAVLGDEALQLLSQFS